MKNGVEVSGFCTKYYKDGNLHREDGPACEYDDGTKSWYLNGDRHREDGPAIEWGNGHREWYQNNLLHRLDGPAIDHVGFKSWYYKGKRLDVNCQEEFEQYLRLRVFW